MKAVVIFVVFLILDIVLDVVFSNINGGLPLVEYYVVAIFLEIAFFGSWIINDISKLGETISNSSTIRFKSLTRGEVFPDLHCYFTTGF